MVVSVKKAQLVEKIAARLGGNKTHAAEALDAVVDAITREIARGERVAIKGFGTFEKVLPKKGRPKDAVARFSAAKELTGVVSGRVKLPKLRSVKTAGVRPAPAPAATVKPAPVTPVKPVVAPAPVKSAAPTPASPAPKAPVKKAPASKAAPTKQTVAKKAAPASKAAPAKKAPAKAATSAPAAQAAPAGKPIKGSAQSKKYHLPGGRWYDATTAQEWFATEADAIAAGYTKAGAPAKKS